jgi:hypothetical protein
MDVAMNNRRVPTNRMPSLNIFFTRLEQTQAVDSQGGCEVQWAGAPCHQAIATRNKAHEFGQRKPTHHIRHIRVMRVPGNQWIQSLSIFGHAADEPVKSRSVQPSYQAGVGFQWPLVPPGRYQGRTKNNGVALLRKVPRV